MPPKPNLLELWAASIIRVGTHFNPEVRTPISNGVTFGVFAILLNFFTLVKFISMEITPIQISSPPKTLLMALGIIVFIITYWLFYEVMDLASALKYFDKQTTKKQKYLRRMARIHLFGSFFVFMWVFLSYAKD